jgi:hypothetical protein
VFFLLIFLPTESIILFIFKEIEQLDVHNIGVMIVVKLGNIILASKFTKDVGAQVIQTLYLVISHSYDSFLKTIEHSFIEVLLYEIGDNFFFLFHNN